MVTKGYDVRDKQQSEVICVCQPGDATKSRLQELCSQLQLVNACNGKDQARIRELLLEYHDVFALNDNELGETDVVTHSIDTGSAPPVKSTPRRLAYSLHKELEKEMDNLLQTCCIELSVSPYASPLVLVRKKTGRLRVCVDYRALNHDTVSDCYLIPWIDKLMDMVGRKHTTLFSSLELVKYYHQVWRKVPNQKLLSLVIWVCISIGGCLLALQMHQRLMGTLFGGKDWDFVFVYLNDTLIAS